MEKWELVYFYIIIAAVCSFLPIVGRYIAIVNTLIHEVWHVVAAIISGRKFRLVHKINLNRDASGTALTQTGSWIGRIFIAYMGYTGSSVTAYGLFYLLKKEHYIAILFIFACVACISLVLWVRNLYGLFWTISFLGFNFWIFYYDKPVILQHVSIFLSCVVLVQSVWTAFIVFRLSIKQSKNAGDATALAATTKIPAFIWGFLFLGQALYFVYLIFL
ncbi:M50 family metallopeptidase [Niallia sp. NCCP-28]|uniref:M50 family metallopeptidase n=1 Tax=Niallia sp. NCCP-28 TaxID=2934712 RepID=UPI00208A7808|nr:M50 family metallopeptidase [Niallia sp. NCCP-28]GKU82228.1 hypothetical protein NCCP28_16240 [Niallia sp. NCCP-28]